MKIKYIHENHIQMVHESGRRCLHPQWLVRLLRSLNSSDVIYLGQVGKVTKNESGMLNQLPGDNYCMGGPGVVFRRSVLKKVAPHIEHCLLKAPKSHMHEDTGLIGQCIQRYVGIFPASSRPRVFASPRPHALATHVPESQLLKSQVPRFSPHVPVPP